MQFHVDFEHNKVGKGTIFSAPEPPSLFWVVWTSVSYGF